MNRLGILLTVFMLALGLTACEKKKKSESLRAGRCARGGCATDSNANGDGSGNVNYSGTSQGIYDPVDGTYWGQIHKGSGTQNQFYEAVKALVSANINSYGNPSELGSVSGDINQSTGVWFWGEIPTANGQFNPTGTNAQINLGSAQLRIVVWDSYAGQQDATGQVIPEYPLHFKGAASGHISGQQATIVFSDQFGTVQLSGQFDQNYFQGTVQFDNSVYFDGQTPGAAGTLGSFFVPTCGFFQCSSTPMAALK